jgi:site-specific DNA recombinase
MKADLTARLAEVPAEVPDILPNVSGVYRKRVQRLTAALNNPKDRPRRFVA